MNKLFKSIALTSLLLMSSYVNCAHAGVVIAGTRVVYPANEREITVKLSNESKMPVLVQAWIDNGNPGEAPEQIEVPFTLTPSIFRMEPKKGQAIRVIYTKEPLPQDKESMYWLNVLEVPPKSAEDADNKMQIAFRTRIKLFFRPQKLPGSSEEAVSKVKWQVVQDEGKPGYALKATNPTAYFVNLNSIKLTTNGKSYEINGDYISPGDMKLFPISGFSGGAGASGEVSFTAINDWGGDITEKQKLN